MNQKNSTVEQKIKRRNFISFGTFALLSAAAFGGWKWLYKSENEEMGITARARLPLRKAMNKTEVFFRNFFSDNNLVKTYPKSRAAKNVRVNSRIGLETDGFNPEEWELSVVKGDKDMLKLKMADLKALPKTEIIFDFKCVEGWDQIQHWAGVRFIDFVSHYHLENQTKMQYIGMKTPNSKYYVGLDMPSAMHPQTILAYEMNGEPLTLDHGAPLRLIIPVKYGIKNLKRIGTISFSDKRPGDYWARHGYDYYSGL
ncbi:molybdopterin-dependent oxidoreductase [Dyadobacter arcticus]|uniref:DMSO/TMAO reductase YedYZ molybdopterin-dependent catalytic subunit n=1 Tax=Dyadobacter arcticus TaxID=1078754 RepID=A0ABX0ULC4_9BACT|nr:molybdopterin-dependent oxidoreductase [Dyadobacter arcticus]NIJ52250.1 DMSO/TMAO reductase YedYZ molybdopterin-dependent catalytic subunit [Dyadobacter arcticus]